MLPAAIPAVSGTVYAQVTMCGIAGLYMKSPALAGQLGQHLSRMLEQLSFRGPDSAGVAFYREPAPEGWCKVSLHSPAPDPDWDGVAASMALAFGEVSGPRVRATHAIFVIAAPAEQAEAWLSARHPELRLMSAGNSIEIYKEAGPPRAFIERFALEQMGGTHALGHTRMATESRVTTEHSHPFSTGLDLCLVHNGSLSNHNRLRRVLQREGIRFQTDNDSEVAAGYLTWRMREGATLEQALEGCMDDLDGFYTFAVGTADGFAALRDPIACKPAVMAETDDWVAMASEYRAIAVLPGAEDAELWEPEPGRVYSWGTAPVA
ncbi:MAG: methylamine---glutamate N-methyltransferase subunit [Solirubrobacteraceae bacterium]|nr:methylamine---glutamate N-methyltransferase subunit [Solirubrobacteraceae bacterium]